MPKGIVDSVAIKPYTGREKGKRGVKVARIEESVEINRPAGTVFAYTTNAGNWPKWQSILPQAEQTSAGPVAVGTTFRGKVHMMGLTMSWTAKTTEYEMARKYAKNITSMAMLVEQHNTYAPLNGGTRFTILYGLKIRGIFKLLSPMIVSTMRKELKKSLGNLKTVLEAKG